MLQQGVEKSHEQGEYLLGGVSKAVDSETGEPMVVYHGTPEQFTTFDINQPVRNGRGRCSWGLKTPAGYDIAGSLKRLPDGNLLYLEEVRSDWRVLAMKSARRHPGTTDYETIKNRAAPSNARSDAEGVRILYAPQAIKTKAASAAVARPVLLMRQEKPLITHGNLARCCPARAAMLVKQGADAIRMLKYGKAPMKRPTRPVQLANCGLDQPIIEA